MTEAAFWSILIALWATFWLSVASWYAWDRLHNSGYATGGDMPAPRVAAYVEPHWIWRERLEEALATLTVADLPRWPGSGADWFDSGSWRRPAARTTEELMRKALVGHVYVDPGSTIERQVRDLQQFRDLQRAIDGYSETDRALALSALGVVDDVEVHEIRAFGQAAPIRTYVTGVPPAEYSADTPAIFVTKAFSESDAW